MVSGGASGPSATERSYTRAGSFTVDSSGYLVNNAGLSLRAAIDGENYEEAWAKALAVMLTAHPRIIRAALPYLRKSKCPRIVNIASTEALGATATNSPFRQVS